MKKLSAAFSVRSKYDKKLIVLYTLNLSDYLFTLILLSCGMFIEANPLLSTSIDGFWGFVLKCIVPFILLAYIHIRLSLNDIRCERAVRILLNIILIYYWIINVFHVFWLTVMLIILSL